MITVTMTIEGASSEELEELRKGGDPLRALSQKEVDRFDAYLQRVGGDYREGLAKFERFAVEGYVYQNLRGHLDANNQENNLPTERQNGAQTST